VVGGILSGVIECHGEDLFANEFVAWITNASLDSRVEDIRSDRVDQSESMIGLAKQDDVSAGRGSLVRTLVEQLKSGSKRLP